MKRKTSCGSSLVYGRGEPQDMLRFFTCIIHQSLGEFYRAEYSDAGVRIGMGGDQKFVRVFELSMVFCLKLFDVF